MKEYFLVGTEAIKAFRSEEFQELQDILNEFNGDLMEWDRNSDSLSELFSMIEGWDSCYELSMSDIVEIELNTSIRVVPHKKVEITRNKFIEWYFEYQTSEENQSILNSLKKDIVEKFKYRNIAEIDLYELFGNVNLNIIPLFFCKGYEKSNQDIKLLDLFKIGYYNIQLV